ncbi:hypothetical protein E6C72_18020 [Azospirillum sp. TSH100]|nr:hypothetical protein E6C72_18020 [Azospirillum sp. TSH100]
MVVPLTLTRDNVPVPVALRLFMPDDWASNAERCRRAGVPENRLGERTKPQVALDELDRVRAGGVRFDMVVAGVGYGDAFRKELSARGLTWAVGIQCTQSVYHTAVTVTWPVAPVGRPRKHAVASEKPVAAAAMLETATWQPLTWRTLAARIKARWVCEQGHQQMKEELGLDNFEGRSWHGLHHHLLLAMITVAFLQHLRLASAPEWGKNRRRQQRTATSADVARHSPSHSRAVPHLPAAPMSLLSVLACTAQAPVELPK